MSLTHWVEWDRELINSLYTRPQFDCNGVLKAEPLTKNYGTIGTAFDYAVRLRLYQLNNKVIKADYLGDAFPLVARNGINGDKKRREYIEKFDRKVLELSGDPSDVVRLLPSCIVLAKIEAVFRSGQEFPNSDIFRIDKLDVQDLANLFGLLDDSLFKARHRCNLNPIFGKSSQYIGGADADLVLDDCLLDIKTTKYLKLTAGQLRQLVGYYILNVREKHLLGHIKRLGIYYSRYGVLYTFPIEGTIAVDDAKWVTIDNSLKHYHKELLAARA